jgi:hypothetical protein
MAALDQQKILSRTVRVDAPPTPGQPDRRWNWVELDPSMLAGEFEFQPEGVTGAANTPQDRNDARDLWMMGNGNANFDQQRLLHEVLRLMGQKRPEVLAAPPQATAPPEALNIIANRLISMGMKPEQVNALMADSIREALGAPPPGGGGPPAQNGAPPQNGTEPVPEPAPAG